MCTCFYCMYENYVMPKVTSNKAYVLHIWEDMHNLNHNVCVFTEVLDTPLSLLTSKKL